MAVWPLPEGEIPSCAESRYFLEHAMNDSNDAMLVLRTCAGEIAAFGELVSRYENSARIVALRYVRNHHSAEDVVQQAFLSGFQQLPTLRDPSKFGAWFLRIVQREACRQHAASGRMASTWTEASEPETQSDWSELNDELQEAVELLNRLPEHERIVMSLHYLDGHSTTAIAQMTGRPIGTITKQLSRATKRIQSLALRQERRHEHR